MKVYVNPIYVSPRLSLCWVSTLIISLTIVQLQIEEAWNH